MLLSAAPQMGGPGIAYAGQSADFALSSNSDGDTQIANWQIDWGDGTGTETISGDPSSCAHTYTSTGDYWVNYDAQDTDGNGWSGDGFFQEVDNPPSLAIASGSTAYEGLAFNLNLVGQNMPTINSFSVNWGDGTGTQSFVGGTSSGSTTHIYADGPHMFNLQATAHTSDGDFNAFETVTVLNVAPSLYVSRLPVTSEGSLYTLNLASADPGQDTINHWSFQWGDGTVQTTNSIVVSGTGTDISGTSDSFEFVNQPLSGDGSILARIASTQFPSGGGKAGVMIRTSTDPTSPYVFMGVGPGISFFQSRVTNSTATTTGTVAPGVCWVKLVRQGDNFVGYTSADASNWQVVGSATVSMSGATPFLGLALASQSTTTGSATFDNVCYTGSLSGTTLVGNWTSSPIGGASGSYSIAASNPTTVTHSYADGPSKPTLQAWATDEDGTYSAPVDLDASFGTNGSGLVSSGVQGYGRAVAVQPGKYVVAGTLGANFAVARFNSNGTLDTTFNNTGYLYTSSISGTANAVAMDTSGNMLLAGVSGSSIVVARVTPQGQLDTSNFDAPNGFYRTQLTGTSNDNSFGIGLQTLGVNDGKIVVGGYAFGSQGYNFVLIRLTPAGVLDTSSATAGWSPRISAHPPIKPMPCGSGPTTAFS